MKWSDLCEDKALEDLPYKIELNRQGQLIMSPHKPTHSAYQAAILRLLIRWKPDGHALPEVAIDTSDGIKVADVAWVSQDTFEQQIDNDFFTRAPELCVEVISASNTMEEMLIKKDRYLERTATEVWICTGTGQIRFFDQTGEIQRSRLCLEFPGSIKLDRSSNAP